MKNRSVFSIVAEMGSLITQLGISVLVCIFGCFFIGRFIDSKLNTDPIFMVIFLVLGIARAFNSVYKVLRKYTKGKWLDGCQGIKRG